MNYCYKCGEKLILKECFNCGIKEGEFPFCTNCNEFRFPFFNCAVSMVIYNKDYSKALLIKQYGKDYNILVAGYVNKSETLEEALRRELKEETNLEVLSAQFNESKYFEKSNTLINNFIVRVKDESFSLNDEVDYAQWYDIEEAQNVVLKNSLAQYFLNLSVEKIKNIKLY